MSRITSVITGLAGILSLASCTDHDAFAQPDLATTDQNVPWLLLNVTSHGGEHGKLSDIVSIQRLQPTGGDAPATGCDADHIGAESDVLYTARYFFYRTSTWRNNVRCGG